MVDLVVIGAGFAGSVIARKAADDGKTVEVIEKRSVLGGNAADSLINDIYVHNYGPHFIHTNNYKVIQYLNQYTKLYPFIIKSKTMIDRRYISQPYNFYAMRELVGDEEAAVLMQMLRQFYYGQERIPITSLLDNPNTRIRNYAQLIFEKGYKNYSEKMWGTEFKNIDKNIFTRLPISLNFDERVVPKDFQFLPSDGYQTLFNNLLNHKNITIRKDTDALQIPEFTPEGLRFHETLVVYTGEIDRFFDYKYGRLPYRTLIFEARIDSERIQPTPIVTYPQAKQITRSVDYNQLAEWHVPHYAYTIFEKPLAYTEENEWKYPPLYPVNNKLSNNIYQAYAKEVKSYPNLIVCGRLGEFKYYDMDAVIESAWITYQEVARRLGI